MNIDRKRIVITGASSGIGRALLQELAQRQVRVVAVGKNEERLRDAVGALDMSQASVVSFACDLALQTGVDHLFDYAVHQMGGIDIFFANAGFAYWERVLEPDWGHIEAIFRTNVLSPIYAAAKMQALDQEGSFRTVITSSVLGRVGLEGYALYCATKAALDRFAEAHRLANKDHGKLTLVYPLSVRSSFYETGGHAPIPWLTQSAASVARSIVRGIEKDRETIYTSWILRPMLLADRLLPFARRWYQAIDARVSRRHWAAQEARRNLMETGREQ